MNKLMNTPMNRHAPRRWAFAAVLCTAVQSSQPGSVPGHRLPPSSVRLYKAVGLAACPGAALPTAALCQAAAGGRRASQQAGSMAAALKHTMVAHPVHPAPLSTQIQPTQERMLPSGTSTRVRLTSSRLQQDPGQGLGALRHRPHPGPGIARASLAAATTGAHVAGATSSTALPPASPPAHARVRALTRPPPGWR